MLIDICRVPYCAVAYSRLIIQAARVRIVAHKKDAAGGELACNATQAILYTVLHAHGKSHIYILTQQLQCMRVETYCSNERVGVQALVNAMYQPRVACCKVK